MTEPRLLFVFSRGWRKRLEDVRAGDAPAEAYGFFALQRRGIEIDGVDEDVRAPLPWQVLGRPIERLWFAPRSGMGYRLRQAHGIAALLDGDDTKVLVPTSDSIGLPLLSLRDRRRIRNEIVQVSIGLCDRIERGILPRGLRERYLRLLARARAVLVFTPVEAELLRKWLPGARVASMPYGVDVDWWTPLPDNPVASGAVFSAGRDSGRAFDKLVGAVADLPVRTTIAGKLALDQGLGSSANLRLTGELSIADFRRELWSCQIAIVPSRVRLYGSGQMTALQAMAAAKPVIFTDTGWARAAGLRDGVHFLDVPPNDANALRAAISSVLERPDGGAALGAAARDVVASTFTTDAQADVILEAANG